MRTISMIREVGGSHVITVPKAWIDYLELAQGDIIEWEYLNKNEKKVKQ